MSDWTGTITPSVTPSHPLVVAEGVYAAEIDSAYEMIKEAGVEMSLIVNTALGSYNATLDTIPIIFATYPIIALIKNPTVQRENGEFGKSDRVRLLIAAKGLPSNLDELDFHVVYGSTVWHPDITTALKPGGTPIMFSVDMK